MTAGNASGINDGAAALVLMSAEEAPSARLDAAGADRLLGDGRRRSGDHGHRARFPRPRKALEKAGWKVKDLDLVEANEAFAAQALAVNKDLGLGSGHRQRQRRRHRYRPSDRRFGRAHPRDLAV